jgi:DNA-binding MarR family transcriptional regulator
MTASKLATWQLWTMNFQLVMAVLQEVSPRVRALRLETKEFFLLAALETNTSPAELARALMLPKPSITFMVKRMEAAGYVRRASEPDDARRFRLTLTASGRRAMESARAILDGVFGDRLARLTSAQRVLLAKLLEQMLDERKSR